MNVETHFDTSKYKRTQFGDTEIIKMNQKKLGMMKDELSGQLMTQFVGIGPKNYAYEYLAIDRNLKEDSRCKGISKSFTPKFQEYLDCIKGVKGNEVNKE